MTQLERIWQQYSSRLLTFIKKRVSQASVADDILQNVFEKTINKIDTVRDKTKIESWLFQVTRHAIIDYYRINKPTEELPHWIEQTETAYEDQVRQELSACLMPMVNKLPEKYRFAVYLSEIEGKSQKEIAERESISLSGAKSRVQRGRHLLKKMLLDCCEVQINQNNQVIDYRQKKHNDQKYLCE